MSLIRAGKDLGKGKVKPDKFAHIRKGISLYSKCGKLLDNMSSVKGCELCDRCFEEARKG